MMTLQQFTETMSPTYGEITEIGLSHKGNFKYEVAFHGDVNTFCEFTQIYFVVTNAEGYIIQKEEILREGC